MALLGGIGGGITRDVMVAEVPAALKNPAYITLCLAAEVVGYRIAAASSRANHSASCATWGCWWRNQMPRGPTGPGTNKGPVGRGSCDWSLNDQLAFIPIGGWSAAGVRLTFGVGRPSNRPR